ncbi:Arsenite efflux pump ArsB, ACR3 family [Alteribacillus persepolensis]|uniref:Arsenite efflux pump ArsB, ACR3 family n=1 Tax=Alteribacillus persepolensis TaxID=568899 RepID=A0A1G8K2M4_9BACI|nr:arsenic resistance protein [Alteribacillus persepolensis]SDI37649.1 Arsenite efflux pump ArsB, ACR3 family [Alteribacillus persepolensis]
MTAIEKWYTVIMFISAGTGILLGNIQIIHQHADVFIVPFLIAMLYWIFLSIPFHKIRTAFHHRTFVYTALGLNFIWNPLAAWGLASVFLSDYPVLMIGFILLLVTPCTDWYLVFTNMAKGNTALSTALLPMQLILQLLLLPVYISLFGGETAVIEISYLLESIIIVLGLPLLASGFTKRFVSARTQDMLLSFGGSLQIICLSLAVMCMFAANGHVLLANIHLLWILAIPLCLFFIIAFAAGYLAARLLRFTYPHQASLILTTLARNSPIALAVALTAFHNEPLIAIALILGPLLELPLLAAAAQLLLMIRQKSLYQRLKT